MKLANKVIPAKAGFSLVEILLIVAAVGVLAGVAYQSVTGVKESSADAKLLSDVRVLNSAIDSYRASGGSLEDVLAWTDVLAKLKSTASNAQEIAAPKGPFIDVRVTAVEQSPEEASTSALRAYFSADGDSPRFVTAVSGPVGIKEFVFDESLSPPAAEERDVLLSQAGDGGWIWAYEEASPVVMTSPVVAVPAVSDATNTNASAAILTLLAPSILPSSPVYDLGAPLQISLNDPNRAGAAQLAYGVGGGTPETLYTASFVLPSPGPVTARALSRDPSRYADSAVTTNIYYARAVLAFDPPPPTSVTYAEAASGTNVVTISNNAPGLFDAFYDIGSTVTTNSSLYSAPVPLNPSLWSNSSSITFEAVAFPAAGAGEYYTNSATVTVSVSAESIQLDAPVITPGSQIVFGSIPLSIAAAPNSPPGTRIYYTYSTDDAAVPTEESGILYAGPFVVSEFGVNELKYVKAKAYAPTNLPAFWFTESEQAEETYQGLNFDYYNLEGVLVGGGNIANNAALNGSVVLVSIDGQQPNVTFNNNSVLNGDIYAPGTPTVTGVSPGRIIDLDGDLNPTNYTINILKADFFGNVYRRITPVTMPVVELPTGLPQYTNKITSGTLPPGQYADVDPGNGDTITVGVAGATEPAVYVFDQFDTGNKFTMNVVGPVILTLNPGAGINISLGNNVVIGDDDHPEWLQVNMFSGNLTVGNGSAMYGSILNPNGTVSFQQNATFEGGVTAKYINIENNAVGVTFSLPPPS